MASPDVNETQQPQHPNNVYHELGVTRNKIITAQFECYQKIMKDIPQSREGALLFFSYFYQMQSKWQKDNLC